MTLQCVTTAIVYAAGDLAEAEGLCGYDAVHLAAATAAHATIVAPSDGKLAAAASRRHFNVANPL